MMRSDRRFFAICAVAAALGGGQAAADDIFHGPRIPAEHAARMHEAIAGAHAERAVRYGEEETDVAIGPKEGLVCEAGVVEAPNAGATPGSNTEINNVTFDAAAICIGY